jgi:hypothetical protein
MGIGSLPTVEVPVIVGLQAVYAVRVLAKLGVSIGLGQ